MTLAVLNTPLRYPAFPYERGASTSWSTYLTSANSGLIDATGERFAFLGRLFICDGSASKTFSSSGGKIHFHGGSSITFGATSTCDIGIQGTTQASAAMLPDGTFTVKKTMVSGTDSFTSSAINSISMGSGSTTLNNHDKIAVVFDLTNASSASIKIATPISSGNAYMANPGCAAYISSAWAFTTPTVFTQPCVLIEFDDGTFGYIDGGMWTPFAQTTTGDIQSSSNPDEYGFRFTVPFKCTLYGVEFPVAFTGGAATGTKAVARLCSGSAASPTLVTSENIDGFEYFANASSQFRTVVRFTSPQDLVPGTTYYVSLRLSSTETAKFIYFVYPAAGQLACLPFGTAGYRVTREADTVGTGAFTEITTDMMPVTLILSKLDDGAGGGGSSGTPSWAGS